MTGFSKQNTQLKCKLHLHYDARFLGRTGGLPLSTTRTTLGTSTSTMGTPTTTTSTTPTSLDQQHLNFIKGWIEAYHACCKHKRKSPQCISYSMENQEILNLAEEVLNKTYKPTTSTCFCVTRPKLREVFAANFRDRIVQHWLCLRLEPLFEQRFYSHNNVSFNCRKGFGVLAAVNRLSQDIKEVTNNYTTSAWIGKFDLKAFFMTIDCNILLDLLLKFIDDNYKGTDIDLVKWVTKIIVTHEPEKDCIKVGNIHLWESLEPAKSLFNTPSMIGMPIGNLTSQLFANFYMSFFDEYILKLINECGGKYVRFVDDFIIVCPYKKDILRIHKLAEEFLKTNLHVTLHKDKVYIQHYTKGVSFIGHVIKPNRIYLSNKTIHNFKLALCEVDELCKKLNNKSYLENEDVRLLSHYLCSVNSLLGFLVHTNSFNIRTKFFNQYSNIWNICYVDKNLKSIHIRKQKYAYNEIYRDRTSQSYYQILEF